MQKGILLAAIIGAIFAFALSLPKWSQDQAINTLFAKDACEGESWLPNIEITPDRRIEYCTEAIKSRNWSGKDIAWAYNNRGITYASLGQYDQAIEDFSYAIKLDPQDGLLRYNRANARRDKRDYEGAIAGYTEAIELDSNYARAYYNRGLAKQAKGDTAGSETDIAAAKRLDPDIDK